jgi:hypothetical protein
VMMHHHPHYFPRFCGERRNHDKWKRLSSVVVREMDKGNTPGIGSREE